MSVLDRDLTDRARTAEVDIAPLLRASHSTLFEAEVARRLKAVPVAAPRTSLLDAADVDFLQGWELGAALGVAA